MAGFSDTCEYHKSGCLWLLKGRGDKMSALYPDLDFTNYPGSLDNIALKNLKGGS